MTLPSSFEWDGSRWVGRSESDAEAESVSLTIGWHLQPGVEGDVPFEQDPELKRQLEALGYL